MRTRLVEAADQCVKCGLCLAHCPTYRVRVDEGESPRGRIALIQGLAEGKLAQSPRLAAHLTSCLGCRACEAACPALVTFGSLMDGARALQKQHMSLWARWLAKRRLRLLSSNRGLATAAALSKLYRATGLGRLVENSGLAAGSRLRAYHRVAMQLEQPRPSPTEQTGDQAPTRELALFLGCVAQEVQPGLSASAHRVLSRLGYRVRIPKDQRCCGAMHRHSGFPAEADRLLAQNASAFANYRTLATASACAAELRTHPGFSHSLEICRFLADQNWPRETVLRPLRVRVAVHVPCSHRNVLRDSDAACDLLRRIPEIKLVLLEETAFCCGAAGTYMLENPAMSATLLAPKIGHLHRLAAKYLATTNTGCALHLAAGAREAGLELEILHPVELIERQLMTRPA